MTVSIVGLGIDAGGTQTRWALANARDEIIAEGGVAGLTALQMATDAGRAHIRDAMAAIAEALPPSPRPRRLCAGMTGFTEGGERIVELLTSVFDLPADAITLHSDIEIACLDLFKPGEGYVVYAGTGSIAAFVDATGAFHRVGGRGVLLDDAGGGYWIAMEALRHIWRSEDTKPGGWRESPLAAEMFNRLGGADWSRSREFVYHHGRGEIGRLALAVAAAADKDAVAQEILKRAGMELARLGQAMIARFGLRPVALAGRVVQLHPFIEQGMRAAMPPETRLQVRFSEAHLAAARIAAHAARLT